MTTDATTSARPAARAAGLSRTSAPVSDGFVATLAAHPSAPAPARPLIGAVAASVKASRASSPLDLPGRPVAAARAASSAPRG